MIHKHGDICYSKLKERKYSSNQDLMKDNYLWAGTCVHCSTLCSSVSKVFPASKGTGVLKIKLFACKGVIINP